MKKHFKLILVVITILITAIISGCEEDPQSPENTDTNTQPTGSAGIGKTVLVGEPAIFEGSAEDADTDDSLSYSWSITSVPGGSSVTDSDISDADTLNASFIPDVPGEYGVQLTVSDGTDSITAEATVRAAGFVIGLNDNNGLESAYIQNGTFHPLDEPDDLDPLGGRYTLNTIEYVEGAVYSAGSFTYQADGDWQQPVYWNNTADNALPLPVGQFVSYEINTLVVEPGGGIQAIVRDTGGSGSFHYLMGVIGYVSDSDAVLADPAWNYYMVTDLFRSGSDVFQIGTAGNEGTSETFFMAGNGAEIVHSTSYVPNPMIDEYFDVTGSLFIRGAADEDSLVYLYGRWRDGNDILAGYTVNDGAWVDLAPPVYAEGYNQYIKYMDSADDYILYYMDEPDITNKVFVNGSEAVMETPHDGESEVSIDYLEYEYMEEIGGSIFVLGGYTYSYLQESYNVAAVWRDGMIVYEGYDDDNTDEYLYDSSSIIGADFY